MDQRALGRNYLKHRSSILNNTDIREKIPHGLMVAAVGLFCLNLLSGIGEVFLASQPPTEQADSALANASTLLNIASAIINLVWVFYMRRGVCDLGGIQKGDRCWPNAFLLFLLQVLYLQYKINQTIDADDD